MASGNNNTGTSHHWWAEPEGIVDIMSTDGSYRHSVRKKGKDAEDALKPRSSKSSRTSFGGGIVDIMSTDDSYRHSIRGKGGTNNENDVEEALKPRVSKSSSSRNSSGGRNQHQYHKNAESQRRQMISKSSSGISNGSRDSSGGDRNRHSRKPSSSSSAGSSSSTRNKNKKAAPQPPSYSSSPSSSSSSSKKPNPITKHSRNTSNGSNQSSQGGINRVSTHSTTSSSSSSKQKESQSKKKGSNDSLTGIDTTAVLKSSSSKSKKRLSSTGSTSGSSHASSSSTQSAYRKCTIKELIQSLGAVENQIGGEVLAIPPALERRVRDFKFAQTKRRERHGEKKPWGIWGLYEHLSDIRADLEWAEDAAYRRQHKQPYLSWSDYEKTHRGAHNRPWFTYGVIALCTIMLIVTIGVNGWKFEPLNVNPMIGPSAETLVKCGARETDLIVNEGQWYRLFTPMVLHAGIVHYVVNMMAMWMIGSAVEQSHGWMNAAVLFCVPAVGGNILSALCLPQYISVGASGGIFGLIGGCSADISINWDLLFLKTTTDDHTRYRHFMVLFWLLMDILVNILIGLTPFVDNFTHLGGFLYGFFCGLSTIERLAVGFFGIHSGKYAKQMNLLMRFGGLIASVLSIMVTTILLSNSDGYTSPCHSCRYISCVPFPPGSDDKWWHCDDCDFVTADLFVAASGSGLYELVELHCPDGEIESIPITEHNLTDREDVRLALPGYCRDHCENVFKKSF